MCQLCCPVCDAGLCLCNFQNCASKQAAVCRQAGRQRCILGRREWSADVRDKGGWIGALQCLFWEYLRRQVRSWQEKEQSMCLCWQQRGFNKQRTFFCTGKNQYFVYFPDSRGRDFYVRITFTNLHQSVVGIFLFIHFSKFAQLASCPDTQWVTVPNRLFISAAVSEHLCDMWLTHGKSYVYLLPNTCFTADVSSQTVMTLHFPV